CWRVRAPVENLGKPQTGPVVLPVFIRLTVVGGVGTRDDWLSMQEASERLHVHADTLRQWADRGRIRTFRTPGGHRRFQAADVEALAAHSSPEDRKSTRLNSSHVSISYAVFCLKKKKVPRSELCPARRNPEVHQHGLVEQRPQGDPR